MSMAQHMGRWHEENNRLTLARERGILVDDQDLWLLSAYTWYVTSLGYVVTQIYDGGRSATYLHHAIMGSPIWEKEMIDHINQQPSDNRRSNLRWATHAQNLRNNNHPLGQTGERGTTIGSNGKYLSRVHWDGTTYHLGSFDTLEEAVAERNKWLHSQRGD